MATVVTQQAPDNDAYAVHRTQAMPKNSLFGTSLEIQNEKDESAVAEQGDQTKETQKELPEHLKPLLQKKDLLHRKRDELERQKIAFRQSHNDLKSVESKALTFNPEPRTTQTRLEQAKSRKRQVDKGHEWFTEWDIDHVNEINIGGLASSGGYNRDRYGRRRPLHRYSQMGDILQPKMEFTAGKPPETDYNHSGHFSVNRLRTTITNDAELVSRNKPKQPTARSSGVELPPNIRHTFGSKLCDEVLSDEKKVTKTIEKQEKSRFPPRRNRREPTPDLQMTIKPEYDGLSNATRYNVFPGYTTGHKLSTMKTTFTDHVFDNRYPVPDEFRYHKDELGKWAEHNVLRERMKKAWDQSGNAGEKKN